MSEPVPDDARILAMLAGAMTNLGASPEQARVMAAQLLKRSRQIAAERGLTEAAAMADLLTKVTSGRKGEYSGQLSPPAPEVD